MRKPWTWLHFNPRGSREPRRHLYSTVRIAWNFNPRGSREPRHKEDISPKSVHDFNPRGSREPRHRRIELLEESAKFQSTRFSRTSTRLDIKGLTVEFDFNPRGSREPRRKGQRCGSFMTHFNPRGSREPRPLVTTTCPRAGNFNPRGSREPRQKVRCPYCGYPVFQSTRFSRTSTQTADCCNYR